MRFEEVGDGTLNLYFDRSERRTVGGAFLEKLGALGTRGDLRFDSPNSRALDLIMRIAAVGRNPRAVNVPLKVNADETAALHLGLRDYARDTDNAVAAMADPSADEPPAFANHYILERARQGREAHAMAEQLGAPDFLPAGFAPEPTTH